MKAGLTHVGRTRPAARAVRREPPPPVESRSSGRALTTSLIAGGDLAAFGIAAVLARVPVVIALAYGSSLALVMLAGGAYRARMKLVAMSEIPARVTSAALALFVLGVLEALAPSTLDGRLAFLPRAVVLAVLAVALISVARSATYHGVRMLRRHRVACDPVVVVGAGEVARQVARELDEHREYGLRPVGFVDDVDPAAAPVPMLGELASLDRVLAQYSVRRVVVAPGTARECDLVPVLRASLRRSVHVYVVPRLHQLGVEGERAHRDCLACIPLQRLRTAAPNRPAWRAKRLFDVVVAGTALVLLSPLLLLLAIGVKLGGPGPVLFRQTRVGQDGRLFELLKFRSLRPNDDSDERWSVADDARQTALGRVMRRYSLDELPQLWNVVRGDMSMVGPRPERPHFVAQFSDQVKGYADRHRVPVGLTGWAQVNGLRGDTSIADRAAYDNHYIDDWSLRRDLSILIATAATVLRDGRRRSRA